MATNIGQHVANLSIFVAHFGVRVPHFGIFIDKFVLWYWTWKMTLFFGVMLWKFWRKGFYEIEHWKCLEYFGILKYKFCRFGFIKPTWPFCEKFQKILLLIFQHQMKYSSPKFNILFLNCAKHSMIPCFLYFHPSNPPSIHL